MTIRKKYNWKQIPYYSGDSDETWTVVDGTDYYSVSSYGISSRITKNGKLVDRYYGVDAHQSMAMVEGMIHNKRAERLKKIMKRRRKKK